MLNILDVKSTSHLACISRPQSLQPDPAAWGCCLLKLRIYLKVQQPGGVMLFLPHELSCSVSSCKTEKAEETLAMSWPWHAKQTSAHLTGNTRDSLPAMSDIWLPASLTCSGPVGRESGLDSFPQCSLESFKLWNYQSWTLRIQSGRQQDPFLNNFLRQFCLKLFISMGLSSKSNLARISITVLFHLPKRV